MNEEDAYSSGAMALRVRRFHTWPMLNYQTIGHHVARMAQIYCEIFGLPHAEVLYYILHHDDGELYGGDVPAPVKRDVPAMKAASDEAEVIGIGKLGVVMP